MGKHGKRKMQKKKKKFSYWVKLTYLLYIHTLKNQRKSPFKSFSSELKLETSSTQAGAHQISWAPDPGQCRSKRTREMEDLKQL